MDNPSTVAPRARRPSNPRVTQILKKTYGEDLPDIFLRVMGTPTDLTIGEVIARGDELQRMFAKPVSRAMADRIEKTVRFHTNANDTVSAGSGQLMYSASCPRGQVGLNGFAHTALFDSGAEINIMSRELAETVGVPVTERRDLPRLVDINGGSSQIQGVSLGVPVSVGHFIQRGTHH